MSLLLLLNVSDPAFDSRVAHVFLVSFSFEMCSTVGDFKTNIESMMSNLHVKGSMGASLRGRMVASMPRQRSTYHHLA